MSARALLNRAVLTSATDVRFVRKLRTLASELPDELLDALLTSASLDITQSSLLHELLTLAPELAQLQPVRGAPPLILDRLRELVGLAPELPDSRRGAILALISLLHQPSRRRRAVAAALAAAAQSSADPAEVSGGVEEEVEMWDEEGGGWEEYSGGLFEAEAVDDGPPGEDQAGCVECALAGDLGAWDEEEQNGVAAPPVDASEAVAPLLRSGAVLVHVLLPHLHASAQPASTAVALSALQQLLTSSSRLDAAGGSAAALPTAALSVTLSALLSLLARREGLGQPDWLLRCLRCAHASVQLLLPRARARPAWLVAAASQWEAALPWEAQLHAWPILDRLAGSSSTAATGATGGTPAIRLVRWLSMHVPRDRLLLALVAGAAIPSLSTRAAVRQLLGESGAHGHSYVTPSAASSAPTPASPAECHAHELASLALGLARTPSADWGLACTQLQPLLAHLATQLGFAKLPKARHSPLRLSLSLYIYYILYIYIYAYVCIYIHVYVYTYTYL